jgi:hypothetical protein
MTMIAATHRDSEADQPENQCGAQDDQHHLAEARPLAEQERDPLG